MRGNAVKARCDILKPEFMPRVLLLPALLLGGIAVALVYAQNASPIIIDYPANESIFPPDMAAPTFLWRDPAPGSISWRIDITFADGSPPIHAVSGGERMRIGEIDPRCVASHQSAPKSDARAGRGPHLDAGCGGLGGYQEALRGRCRNGDDQRLCRRRRAAGFPRTDAAPHVRGSGRSAHLLPRRAADALEIAGWRHQAARLPMPSP